jgi:hypothetical protein
MAFMLGFIVATLGVLLCIAAGVFLLLIPGWRQLAPYAFLVYPSAYVAGLLCFFVFGLMVNGMMEPESNLGALIAVLLIFGLAALGALAGAISGFASANRLWWRFFAVPKDLVAFPKPLGWLALTPFVRRIQVQLRYHWSRAVEHSVDSN